MRILGDRLLLSPLPAKKLSDGGIHLPEGQAGDKMMLYRIEQFGTQVKTSSFPPGTRVGSIVITPLYITHTTLEDGSDRKIVGTDQIHGVLEEALPAVPDI